MMVFLCLWLIVPALAVPGPGAVPQLTSADTWIIGGREVYPAGKWPWQGSLQHKDARGDWVHACGAVLITPRYALTAAHCVDGIAIVDLRVSFGVHDIITRLNGQPEDCAIKDLVIHPDWSNIASHGFPNDIAVLNLTTPIDVAANDFIDVAIMAESTAGDYTGEDCMITGWGRDSPFGDIVNILRELDIEVITDAECLTHWPQVDSGHVCVYDRVQQSSGPCNGDSGSPLQCNMGGQWDIAGLSSWGATDCLNSYPPVYTRMSYFRDWVDSVIGAK